MRLQLPSPAACLDFYREGDRKIRFQGTASPRVSPSFQWRTRRKPA